jgi:hypothetical protein
MITSTLRPVLARLFGIAPRPTARDRRRAFTLESLEGRQMLSTTAVAVPHTIAAEVSHTLHPNPSATPAPKAVAPSGLIHAEMTGTERTASMVFMNSTPYTLNNVKILHSYGGRTDTLKFGTVKADSTSSAVSITYYTGSGSPADLWSMSSSQYVAGLIKLDMHTGDIGKTVYAMMVYGEQFQVSNTEGETATIGTF